jgi:hypothetical protein
MLSNTQNSNVAFDVSLSNHSFPVAKVSEVNLKPEFTRDLANYSGVNIYFSQSTGFDLAKLPYLKEIVAKAVELGKDVNIFADSRYEALFTRALGKLDSADPTKYTFYSNLIKFNSCKEDDKFPVQSEFSKRALGCSKSIATMLLLTDDASINNVTKKGWQRVNDSYLPHLHFFKDYFDSLPSGYLPTKELTNLQDEEFLPLGDWAKQQLVYGSGKYEVFYAGKTTTDAKIPVSENEDIQNNIQLGELAEALDRLKNYAAHMGKKINPSIVIAQYGNPSAIATQVSHLQKQYPNIEFKIPNGSSPQENIWGPDFYSQYATLKSSKYTQGVYVGAKNTVTHIADMVGMTTVTLSSTSQSPLKPVGGNLLDEEFFDKPSNFLTHDPVLNPDFIKEQEDRQKSYEAHINHKSGDTNSRPLLVSNQPEVGSSSRRDAEGYELDSLRNQSIRRIEITQNPSIGGRRNRSNLLLNELVQDLNRNLDKYPDL